jgi:hypothetical protein
MSLARASLSFPIQISAGTTSTVYSVSAGKTAYVRTIMIYNLTFSAGTTQNVQVHMVKNVAGNVGTASTITRIARIGLNPDDTFFFEPAYPLVLNATGDSIQIYNEGSISNPVNVVISGDREF